MTENIKWFIPISFKVSCSFICPSQTTSFTYDLPQPLIYLLPSLLCFRAKVSKLWASNMTQMCFTIFSYHGCFIKSGSNKCLLALHLSEYKEIYHWPKNWFLWLIILLPNQIILDLKVYISLNLNIWSSSWDNIFHGQVPARADCVEVLSAKGTILKKTWFFNKHWKSIIQKPMP
jgi:hypothetical protein